MDEQSLYGAMEESRDITKYLSQIIIIKSWLKKHTVKLGRVTWFNNEKNKITVLDLEITTVNIEHHS